MFPSFIGILDIQSWWEVPSIAYFCSLFRAAFNLLDFDIEELEEALLTDGTEESSSLLTELIVRLLNGCLGNNDISAFNYQMYLRRLFRRKCQETGRYNPFNTDIDFQFLPLRTKVEILYALCDFRLDADDVFDLFKNLEAESLRVEPLGWDDNDSAYWYFYGTRLYREDIIKKPRGKNKKKKGKEGKKRGWFYGDDWLDDEESERVWQVVCFTEEDWTHLTEKFGKATSKVEKELYRSLSQNFLPEIPRLFQEKERLQRKRLLELAPRRTSSRVLQKIKQKEEENKPSDVDSKDEDTAPGKDKHDQARENRAKRRELLRSKSVSSDTSDSSASEKEMPQKVVKMPKGHHKRSKNSSATHKGEPPPEQPVKTGRKTNNSLASATGQIVIPDTVEPVNSTRKKLKTSQIFSQSEEDIQTDMYKVLEQLISHDDAWPFMDPVEEEYAPNYYAVIRRPMDLHKMEERLDTGYYTDFSMFKADFKLIVNNCRLYNGQDNEYTTMVDNLQTAFDKLTEKYIHRVSSSDEEIAVEYQLPTPSRKHKLKTNDSPPNHKRKKRKSETGERTAPEHTEKDKDEEKPPETSEVVATKESHKVKDGKVKKKHKGHRHGKHSKNHKKEHKSDHSKSSKHIKKQKHGKNRDGKKSKKKRSKHAHEEVASNVLERSVSHESLESSNRSRSASPLPSIHSPTPSPRETSPPKPLSDPDFYKDKYDKIKERRRNVSKDAWDSLFDYKQKNVDKQKQNLNIPEKEKNQKLRETIEKLKAKNQKYKSNSLFNKLFAPGQSNSDKVTDNDSDLDDDDYGSDDEPLEKHVVKQKASKKASTKKNATTKNESASEALEQAVKDISKWFNDAPKGSSASSPCDSPAQTISTEEQDNSRQDDEFDKSLQSRKDLSRKRHSSREPKVMKRREIQRTIDRLQPGKSKGNLLTNISSKNVEKPEEVVPPGPLTKTLVRETAKPEESSPKLSLGSVLPTVEFTLGNDHNFGPKEEKTNKEEKSESEPSQQEPEKDVEKEELVEAKPASVEAVVVTKAEVPKVEVEPVIMKPSQEKATPNLSAWFKAFGAPKSTTSTTTPAPKKKNDDVENFDKVTENVKDDVKQASSPKNSGKYDSPTEVDGGDSPLPAATPRQRRTSTGSSVSERSSFSQDLDSPRHQMSHTSPLLRSPASPRTEDFQKITYPIINGTVRAGFYQDTTSIKSSPEKSCSPREGPQSPYSPYSQHVYASNNPVGATTPNYFIDHNKSPLPNYGQSQAPPYYDTVKAPGAPVTRAQEDYMTLAPDSYQHSQYNSLYSPIQTGYSQNPPTYASSQHSPQASQSCATSPAPSSAAQVLTDAKMTLFPVKKRTYNEVEPTNKNTPEPKDNGGVANQNKSEHQKASIHNITTMPNTSVDDIAMALSEKSEISKLNSIREKSSEFSERLSIDNRDAITHNYSSDKNKDSNNMEASNKPIAMTKQDNIDMVNMGYMNPETERRMNEHHEQLHYSSAMRRDIPKTNLVSQPKGYEIDAIAMNLGMNNQNIQSAVSKASSSSNVIPAAHSHERSDMRLHLMQAHDYEAMALASSQAPSNFSLNDIELANKKLYSCNTTAATSALDYGNWKMGNPISKHDAMPSNYTTAYTTDKHKADVSTSNSAAAAAAAINYNKSLQQQQYHNYSVPRTNLQTLPSELRIPNPRGLLKNDHMSVASSLTSNDYIMNKNVDSTAKTQKSEKLIQSHSLVSSLPYKTPYSSHSGLPLDTLRNLPNIPQMLERYTNDERYLSSFAASNPSLYHNKTFQMAQMTQMLNKSMSADIHSSSSTSNVYSQPSTTMVKDTTSYKTSPSLQNTQLEIKAKSKRKRTAESKQNPILSNQGFHSSPCNTDVMSSVKPSMVPGSAFNFGSPANMTALGGTLYGDNSGFSMEDFRKSTANQLMAANYMAAVAHQRSNVESNADKLAKPAHQSSGASFGLMGAGQSRAGYGFPESSSPFYQQYLQRQEELLRQTGAQIMGLYPPGYPAALAARQPYDSINRPSWL